MVETGLTGYQLSDRSVHVAPFAYNILHIKIERVDQKNTKPRIGRYKKKPMIQLARIHAYRQGIFQLIDAPESELKERKKQLLADGYVISHIEYV
jgi:hypothetical protein